MKTFSFLNWFTFVCLAFVLVFVGNTADAQEAGVSIVKNPSKQYNVEDTVVVTLTTTLDGNPAPNKTLHISVHGGIAISGYSNTPKAVQTDGNGEVELKVRIVDPPSGSIRVEWREHLFDQSTTLVINPRPPTVVTKEVPVGPKEGTSLVVLPPIPCKEPYRPLSILVKPYLKDVIERVESEDRTPTSLTDIKTHQGLLDAIEPLRDDLGGLAARWDDPDPNADPADPTDKDTPPNIFRVPIVILNADDLSGWHFDIAYNPQILEVVEVSGDYEIFEGDFLEQGNTVTFFQEGSVQQEFGEIVRISQSRISVGDEVNDSKADLVSRNSDEWETEISGRKPNDSINGATGTGELVSICFRVKEFAEESLGLHNLQLSDSLGNRIEFTTIVHPVVVTHKFAPEDVNRDTEVNIKDLMVIAANLGLAKPIIARADVNNDGIVNALDLVIVAQHIKDKAPAVKVREQNMLPAPPLHGNVAALDPETIQAWIDFARVADDGSIIYDLAISNLEGLLVSHTPTETKLLLNYPNPFNPETWIPYQLAEATEVNISIYSVNGNLIRSLALGHQAAGTYQSKSQAAYWDGRNELGERVASGVYFYTFTAGKFSATGKMLVRK